MKRHRIALIPGDGIGGEVLGAACRVLDAVGERTGFELRYDEHPWGCEYYLRTGEMMPADGLERLSTSDAILLGAVGYPGVPDHVSLWGLLIPIRRGFQQYVNLRPIRLFEAVESPLRDLAPDRLDMVIVRENTEGEYSQIGGRLFEGTERELAIQQATFSRHGVQRLLRYGFELATTRRGRVTSATKSNGIPISMPFWDQLVDEVASEYRDVEVEHVHVDALAAGFVLTPHRFDVVVGSNLFGDILSDLGAAIAGSIGLAPAANLNPERRYPSMFEPVHGSAPDIAGRGIANPIGAIWSAAMMLDHLGHTAAAAAVVEAIARVLAAGRIRTADLGGDASTESFADAVVSEFTSAAG